MILAPGDHLGPYEVVAPLGAGGMGEVYKARDTRLDRLVALKVLGAAFRDDPAGRERFEREARTIAALAHPHICVLHDVSHHDGTAFLVMEYLEGETLAARLARRARACRSSRRSISRSRLRRRSMPRITAGSSIAT